MMVVDSLLKLWYKQEHRVLLFTQSKQVILHAPGIFSHFFIPYILFLMAALLF